MAPKKQLTARDLVAKKLSPEAKAAFLHAIKLADQDQRALLKKAAKIDRWPPREEPSLEKQT